MLKMLLIYVLQRSRSEKDVYRITIHHLGTLNSGEKCCWNCRIDNEASLKLLQPNKEIIEFV